MPDFGVRVSLWRRPRINGESTGGSLDLRLITTRAFYAWFREKPTIICSHSYQLVWNATQKVYSDMIDCEGWAEKGTANVPRIQSLTTKVSVFVQRSSPRLTTCSSPSSLLPLAASVSRFPGENPLLMMDKCRFSSAWKL